MKRVLLMAGIGIGIVTIGMASAPHKLAPVTGKYSNDTVPKKDTGKPKKDTLNLSNLSISENK